MYEKKIPKTFECGFSILAEIIGGKWKPYLLFLIHNGVKRPSELSRRIPSASLRVLNLQLKELESHGIIEKTVYPELPPKVEYSLTEFGLSLIPVVSAMDKWGENYMETFLELREKQA
jgi:DNA-binding HxlR family transcriptional regulator